MSKSKPDGYWKSLENCVAEAKSAMEKEGWETLPGGDVLIEKGYSSLSTAISQYHGGYHAFRKILGQEQLKREDGVWKDLHYALQQAREAMEKEGWKTLPGPETLKKRGYSSFALAISKYHGGMHTFRKALGQEQLQRERGAWKDITYVIQQAKEAMEKEGWEKLPGYQVLEDKGYGALNNAIQKHHGGMNALRKLLGQEQLKREGGIWKDLKYTLQQAREAMQKEGWKTLPAENGLYKRGYSSLSRAIVTYHCGFHQFRKLLGQEQLIRERGVWKDITYAIQQAREAMHKEGWTALPSGRVLTEKGYSSLLTAIYKYHGGLSVFRDKLNEALGINPGKEQLEEIIKEYLK
jgi:superoxide dismutase